MCVWIYNVWWSDPLREIDETGSQYNNDTIYNMYIPPILYTCTKRWRGCATVIFFRIIFPFRFYFYISTTYTLCTGDVFTRLRHCVCTIQRVCVNVEMTAEAYAHNNNFFHVIILHNVYNAFLYKNDDVFII